jgi:3-keto-disaccharide hydrolase
MASENKHQNKQLKITVGITVLLLLLVSSSIFFAVKIADGQENTARVGSGAVVTSPAVTPFTPSLTPQPLFSDNFIDNKKGWYIGDISGYTRLINNNTLTLSDTNHKVLTESLPTSTSFDDFTITTTFTLLRADAHDSVGLYLRGDSNLDHDYRVEVFGDTSYAISKEWLDTAHNPTITYLISPTHTMALKPAGQQNTVTIIMKGPNLTLLINNTFVSTLADSDYTHGQIALFVNNGETSDGVTAVFSSIVVYPVPDQVSN